MEIALAPAVVPVSIDVRADFEFRRADRQGSDHIPLIEGALHSMAAQLFSDAEGVHLLLMNHFAGRVQLRSAWEFLPSSRSEIVVRPLRFELTSELRRIRRNDPIEVARWRPLGTNDVSIELILTSVEFRGGSLTSTMKALLTGSAFVVTTIVAIGAQGPVQKELSDYQVRQTITRTYQGEPCFSEATFSIDAKQLMEAVAQDLDYTQDIPDDEKRRRICLVQGMLNASGRYDSELDGIAGPVTRQGIKKLQDDHDLAHADVSDVEVRRALFRDWLAAVRKMREEVFINCPRALRAPWMQLTQCEDDRRNKSTPWVTMRTRSRTESRARSVDDSSRSDL